jgi:tRNA A-37 threonylcarbamoyl transferase component Bud32
MGVDMPKQGWKVHVSAGLDNVEKIIEVVWQFCVERNLPFKFLPSRSAVFAANSKYAPRASSGKAVTIYPGDEVELGDTLSVLGTMLDGEPGPYILSDLRWRSGPLYVRYGGFVERTCRDDSGDLVPAIEDPQGRLVPDPRTPAFQPPDWATPPDCLAPAYAARNNDDPGEFPYRVQRAVHYSNGGGVYLAEQVGGDRPVVLKEARPHAGLDANEVDAVGRLHREHRILTRLAGLECVPELIDYRTWWEHHFLVEEHIDGATLNQEMVRRNPLVHPEPSAPELAEYAVWALDVLERVSSAVAALHARGIVFGDLHPNNIVVRPDGRVVLVDFELSSHIDEGIRPGLGAPGYLAPPHCRGFQVDEYALACLRLALFLPLPAVLAWDPGKPVELAHAVTERFAVPEDYVESIVRVMCAERDWRTPARSGPEPPRDAVVAAILSSATPDRADRLFPGDIEQFTAGGLGLAYGAAGVLWALAEAGAGRHAEHEQWLLAAAARGDRVRPGFYDGLHGVAYALDRLDRRTDALEVLDRARSGSADPGDASLYSGLAGIGLNLTHFGRATGDSGLDDLAARATRRAIGVLTSGTVVPRTPGLMHGWSGLALLLIRRYELTGEPALLDLAGAAVRRDLDRCLWTEDGTLQVEDGRRALPYLATGSAGIGIVLREYLRHRPAPDLAAMSDGIRRACSADFTIQSGLFNGRAGLMMYLRLLAGPDATPARAYTAHLRNLSWHAVPYRGNVAFLGDQLLRLSMDLATGSAGVLLALSGGELPFLTAAPDSPDRARQAGARAGTRELAIEGGES